LDPPEMERQVAECLDCWRRGVHRDLRAILRARRHTPVERASDQLSGTGTIEGVCLSLGKPPPNVGGYGIFMSKKLELKLKEGDPAPNFVAETNGSGKVSLSELAGKNVILNGAGRATKYPAAGKMCISAPEVALVCSERRPSRPAAAARRRGVKTFPIASLHQGAACRKRPALRWFRV